MSELPDREAEPREETPRREVHDEKKRLAVFQEVVDAASIEADVELLVVFHLLPDTRRFLRHVTDVIDVDRIIGVPDGSKPETATAIDEAHDVDLTVPETVDEVIAQSRAYVEEFVATREPDEWLLVLDVGGHCASFVTDVDTSGVVGVVEDTNQGHWKYEQLDLPVPVYSIAQAPVKMPENRLVGDAVVFSTENVLRNVLKQDLNGQRVLVLGFGNIGESAAAACRGRGASVMVYDADPLKNVAARLEGYTVEDRETMLGEADIVIGTAGTESLSREDFDHLSDGVVLASGSSHQVEFDVDGLHERGTVVERTDVSATHVVDGERIVLLNEGWPVNFLDNSISNTILDLIFSGLFVCIRELVEPLERDDAGRIDPGIHEPDEERIAEVAWQWLESN